MASRTKNEKLAAKAYAAVEASGQYKGVNASLNKTLQIAKAAHIASGRSGSGPTENTVLIAAMKHEMKEMNKMSKKLKNKYG
jgi:hypothetical protein